ncbi:unnamed protein product [Lampetra planeri]
MDVRDISPLISLRFLPRALCSSATSPHGRAGASGHPGIDSGPRAVWNGIVASTPEALSLPPFCSWLASEGTTERAALGAPPSASERARAK